MNRGTGLNGWTVGCGGNRPMAAAANRCRQPMPHADAANRCRQPMPPTDAANRCRQPMPPTDAACRCRQPMPHADAANRCRMPMPPTDADAACRMPHAVSCRWAQPPVVSCPPWPTANCLVIRSCVRVCRPRRADPAWPSASLADHLVSRGEPALRADRVAIVHGTPSARADRPLVRRCLADRARGIPLRQGPVMKPMHYHR